MKWTVLCIALALAGCHARSSESGAPAEDPGSGPRTMRCTANGLALAGSGPQVGIGSFGLAGDKLTFSLSLDNENGGRHHIVSSGLLALPTHAGAFHFPELDKPGGSPATYIVRDASLDPLREYNGGNFDLLYATRENDPASKLSFTVGRFDLAPGHLPGFKRVHLAGEFHFNAAYLPYVNGNPSEACTTDAIKRSMSALGGGARYPQYDPKVCGGQKTEVACTYDVTQDLLAH